MKPTVAVITLTYNIEAGITEFLTAVTNLTYPNYKLVIIDNNSTDLTIQIINDFLNKNANLKSKTILEVNKQNLGFAKGINQGLTTAYNQNADYFFIINPDTHFDTHILETGLDVFEKHPDCQACAPIILFPDRRIWWIGTKLLNQTEVLKNLGYKYAYHVNKGEPFEDVSARYFPNKKHIPLDDLNFTGCTIFFTKKAFETTAGLNEKYFMYGEDLDFSIRLREAGFKPYLYTDASVYHDTDDGNRSFTRKIKNIKKYYRHRIRSMILFVFEHYPIWVALIWLIKFPFMLVLANFKVNKNAAQRYKFTD